jgi:predicted glycogen debranching enzyme
MYQATQNENSGRLDPVSRDVPVAHEWLVTNGLGGYASGTVTDAPSRRYHGLLIAALPAPLGRRVMFNRLSVSIRLSDGSIARFRSQDSRAADSSFAIARLASFRLDCGLPVWRYEFKDAVIEKRVMLVHQQNTVHVHFRLVEGKGPVRVRLRPSIAFRSHEAPVDAGYIKPYTVKGSEQRYEITANSDYPPLRMFIHGNHAAFTIEGELETDIYYRMEAERGYESHGSLWDLGYLRADLEKGRDAALVASTEQWETVLALSPPDALRAEFERRARLLGAIPEESRQGLLGELVLAADQFVIKPAGRVQDAARAHAAGDEACSVIAGYHWFTDWGRDTMISLEGLTLSSGRANDAGCILRTFAHYVRDGLIPNLFPEREREGLYHTADATLWFFHAINQYLRATNDRLTLKILLPTLLDIVDHHLKGTRFGIGVDHRDGLLTQGSPEHPLTWMDAKVGDWIVTPRRGKAVEINALWYNALKLLEGWVREEQGDASAAPLADHAEKARRSFNSRFWYEKGGHLYDVVDGETGTDDPACRPNQLFAISLEHPVLDQARWSAVFDVVTKKLLTPVGLRSLSPDHPDFKPRYDGDRRARDAAYHQGTVWAWLIGPYIDVWQKLHPNDPKSARRLLDGFNSHCTEACVGSISEVFDAEPPYTPRGCIAQAWSVAEVMRAWFATGDRKAVIASAPEQGSKHSA